MKNSKIISLSFLSLFFLMMSAGCVSTTNKAFRCEESQVELRSIQTRAFDTIDKKKMLQIIISTMQDLDFVIDKADLLLGSVTGTKFVRNASIIMTVTVRSRGGKQLLVRANARCGVTSVKDPETYQDFFMSLEKSLFLTAHQID